MTAALARIAALGAVLEAPSLLRILNPVPNPVEFPVGPEGSGR
jgi:hypothetical protein